MQHLLSDVIYKKRLDLDISTIVKFIVLFDKINAKCLNGYTEDNEYVESVVKRCLDDKLRCSSIRYRREEFLVFDEFVVIKRALCSYLIHIVPYLEDEDAFEVYLIDNKFMNDVMNFKNVFSWKPLYNNELLFFEFVEDGEIYKLDFSNRYSPVIRKFF